jgi:hypothetical protein
MQLSSYLICASNASIFFHFVCILTICRPVCDPLDIRANSISIKLTGYFRELDKHRGPLPSEIAPAEPFPDLDLCFECDISAFLRSKICIRLFRNAGISRLGTVYEDVKGEYRETY